MDKKGKFNILHIDGFQNFGGAQTDILILLKFIKLYYSEKFNIYVIHNDNERLKHELYKEGINNISIKMRNFLDIGAIFKIRKFIKRYDVDLVNFHSSKDHYLGGIASLIIFNKKIVRVLTRHVAYNVSFFKGFLIYKFLTDYFITISDFIKNGLIRDVKINPEKIQTIYSPRIFDNQSDSPINSPEEIQILRKELGIKHDEKMVSLIGRLSKEKGHKTFVLAAKEIVKARRDVKFVIIGEGELHDEISELIAENDLNNYFIFLGFQNDIKRFIAASDAIAVPSGLEGMGSIIIESCALKKAVVASNVGGIPEIIKNGQTGLLFESGNYEELAGKILRLIDGKDLSEELGYNCYKEVIKQFDAKKVADETVSLYLKLLSDA